MTKARILYILPPTRKFAGIERVVDEIADAIAADYGDRFEISVLHLADYGDFVIGARRYTVLRGNVQNRWHMLRVIRQVVKTGSFDLVIVPQIEATTLVWLACLGLDPGLILHLHGNPHHENTHPKAQLLFALFRRLVLERLSQVFGTSPKQLDAFARDFPSHVGHHWAPNPVRRFAQVERRRTGPQDEVVFVSVGRFCRQKGQDLMIEAFAELSRLRPRARLVLVGYGDEEAELKARVDELGLAHRIAFEHRPQDPSEALANADVYLSMSRWEGWSLAICEALRFGLPVVSSDCDFGPSDILVDARLGQLFAPGDRSQAVSAMLYYCDNLVAETAFAGFRAEHITRFDVENAASGHVAGLCRALEACGSTAKKSAGQDARDRSEPDHAKPSVADSRL